MDKQSKGVITVEACLVFPIFICVLASIVVVTKVYTIDLYMDNMTSQTARELAVYTAIELPDDLNIGNSSVDKDIDELGNIMKTIAKVYLKEQLENQLIKGIMYRNGLTREYIETHNIESYDMSKSTLIDSNGCVYINVDYKVKLALPFIPIQHIKRSSVAVVRSWANITIPTVWVSEYGSKYHMYGCRYIFKNIQEITVTDIGNLTPCRSCKPILDQAGIYYRTSQGNRYHVRGCLQIFKNLREISLEEAQKRYSPCSTCIGKE